ncbi:MAG: amidase [Gammaproteobacteria bacterium]|nr:amidase [Gammaproteobacteria bacterium]
MSGHGAWSALQPPPAIALEGPHADLCAGGVAELAARLRRGELSVREVTSAYLERIAALDQPDRLNAWITVCGDRALAEADRLDTLRARGAPPGPLHGVPLAIKDAIDTAGVRTTGGTRVLTDWIPPADATVVRLLRAAGAVVLGKTNLHEWSFGITSANPHYGAVRNPYARECIPGGSSGGTAAAVSARLAPAGLGTDTGGSVRIPAALCGVVGVKPTLGRVSRAGLMGLSTTCDVVGPMARDVADVTLLMRVLCSAADPDDAATATVPATAVVPDPALLPADPALLRGLRIGVPGGYFAEDLHPQLARVFAAAVAKFAAAGAEVIELEIADAALATTAGFLVVVPETIALAERYWRRVDPALRIDDCLDAFGPDVRRVFAGEKGPDARPVPAHQYLAALTDGRGRVRRGFDAALARVDCLLTPATPAPAVALGECETMLLNGHSVDTFLTFTRFTFCISFAGLPAVCVPAGMSADGLPIGIQIVGPAWSEQRLLGIAAAWQHLAGG